LEIKRLRDLPGVSEIEALCQVPSYFDERNIRETMERIDAVSIGLFSLSYFDTDYDCFYWDDDEDPPSEERWDGLLSNALKPYGETEAFWRALGWDITDGRGRELDCAHYFARQTIIAESGWIEGAWGESTNRRRAKFYTLTKSGVARLGDEKSNWTRVFQAVNRVLGEA